MNSWTVRNMCLFSGSRRSKLPYSSVLILVWLLGRVSIVLARMFMMVLVKHSPHLCLHITVLLLLCDSGLELWTWAPFRSIRNFSLSNDFSVYSPRALSSHKHEILSAFSKDARTSEICHSFVPSLFLTSFGCLAYESYLVHYSSCFIRSTL